MAVDADAIVVGANGDLYVAPTGTTLPADSTTALDAAFDHVGYINEDGAQLSDAKTVQTVKAWQAFYAVRRIVTDRDFTVGIGLREWNAVTVPLAFGGTITEPDPTGAPGEFKFTPPSPEDRDERAVVVEWQDGTKNYRLVIPAAETSDTVNTALLRTAPSDLPITLGVNATDGADPWNFFTDDPAWDPA